jgi:DMSO/TMAO reductase YedYZ molybdopterin-dependent catalytic subunit
VTSSETVRSRRGFLATVAVATGTLGVLTVGQSLGWLRATNLFAPRAPADGPQQLAVNRTAAAAQVEALANDPGWQLTVTGPDGTLAFGRAQLLGLPQTDSKLPITCVEGWSTNAHWRGVRVRDLLAQVGAPEDAAVRLTSLEPEGVYRVTDLPSEFVRHRSTLVALELNGETLYLDHGYPARLIAPNRPGVLQTKWLSRLEVLPWDV